MIRFSRTIARLAEALLGIRLMRRINFERMERDARMLRDQLYAAQSELDWLQAGHSGTALGAATRSAAGSSITNESAEDARATDELMMHRKRDEFAEQGPLRALGPSVKGTSDAPKNEAVTASDAWRYAARYPFPILQGMPQEATCVSIIDVGAEPLEFEEDIYAPLVREGRCNILGFDPFLGKQTAPDSTPRRRILPFFIGNGRPAQFHVNRYSPTSSLFHSDLEFMSQFSSLSELCATTRIVDVETRRLDDIPEIDACDFLKIDVQGSELDVLAGSKRTLESTLFVHVETEFAPIYKGQPLFADIDVFLRQQGFEFLDFVKFGWNNYRALPSSVLRSRLLWADSIYIKTPGLMADPHPMVLLRAAFIAHVLYRKYDLATHLIGLYDRACRTELGRCYVKNFSLEIKAQSALEQPPPRNTQNRQASL